MGNDVVWKCVLWVTLILGCLFLLLSAAAAQESTGTLYMVSSYTNNSLYTVNTGSGTATLVGGTGTGQPAGLAFSSDGTLYMVGDLNSGSLYTVNTGSGTATLVGGMGTSAPSGLAFSSDGTLYVVDALNKSLYTVNTGSGTATLVGGTGTGQPSGLAFSSDGTLYMVDDYNNSLYTVNTGSGTATLVGGTGTGQPSGLAFSWDGTLYMIEAYTDRLYTVNTGSGTATLVGSTGTGTIRGLAFMPVPVFGFDSDTAARNLPSNTPSGGVVGLPVVVDVEGAGSATYTIGGTDASSFDIGSSTGQLTVAAGVTIGSTGDTYTVTVTATDEDNESDTVTVTITVTGANDAPVFESATETRNVDENSPAGTNVGEPVMATDENNDAVTYTMGGTDASSYEIGSSTGQITVAAGVTLDYETDNSDTVTVTATDPYVWSDTVAVIITINDVIVSGSVDPPPNVQVVRSAGNESITISWSAPGGGADKYTVQRQELVVQETSTFFANITTVGGTTWLPGNTLTYEDSGILPGRTYEYRVAALKGEVVGGYSDWYRTTPHQTIFGDPPKNIRLTSDTVRGDRREVWLSWDPVDGADDYEIEVTVSNSATAGLQTRVVVTDPTYFHTARSRAEFRVRGRNEDSDLCGSGTGDRCYTTWTALVRVGYVMPAPMEALATPVPPGDRTVDMRISLEGALTAALEPTGAPFDPGDILNLLSLVVGFVVAAVCFAGGYRAGMVPLGGGIAAAFSMLWLWLSIRLLDVPATWGIVGLVIVLVGGGLSAVVALGLVRR